MFQLLIRRFHRQVSRPSATLPVATALRLIQPRTRRASLSARQERCFGQLIATSGSSQFRTMATLSLRSPTMPIWRRWTQQKSTYFSLFTATASQFKLCRLAHSSKVYLNYSGRSLIYPGVTLRKSTQRTTLFSYLTTGERFRLVLFLGFGCRSDGTYSSIKFASFSRRTPQKRGAL